MNGKRDRWIWIIACLLVAGAWIGWRSMPPKPEVFPTGIRVTKIRSENNGTVIAVMNYLVCEKDGSTKSFSDTEPFGLVNELIVNKGQFQERRYRNEPGAKVKYFDAGPAITPEDDAEFAELKKVVDARLDVEKLPWMILSPDSNTETFDVAKQAGWLELPQGGR